ncbi:MAG UNVERIFIED_CONTAM: hypothetical protein LVQ98_05500 [Rickettsiaceae bacterium]
MKRRQEKIAKEPAGSDLQSRKHQQWLAWTLAGRRIFFAVMKAKSGYHVTVNSSCAGR